MKNKSIVNIAVMLIAALLLTSFGNLKAQIANGYPYDSLIHNDPDVIFTEMFEGTVSSLTASGNWNRVSPNPANIRSDSSIPSNSHGRQSLRLITLDDNTTQNENTLVYKLISPNITDSIFVRYYIKYDTNTVYHHSGLWVGGKNPPSTNPGNIGGQLPLGNQEFHIGTEIRGLANGMPISNSLFGFYTYWMGMHPNSSNIYYGNEFLNRTTKDHIDLSAWNCIEMLIKLNNPISVANGELKLWVNGVQVSHLGYQFPTGSWNQTQFTEGTGTPFEGFQFRNDAALNLNYIWLRNYNTNNNSTHSGNIYFDHLVVAKKYIGPIATNPISPPLAIDLLSFKAKCVTNNIVLEWTTANEKNNNYFTLERSTEGINWTTIETVKGAGNSSTILNYSFTDFESYTGVSYYRLKQTDFKGQFEYSNIVVIENCREKSSGLIIYPLPANDIVKFSTKFKNVYIFNIYGQIVLQAQNTESISTGGLQDGLYLIQADNAIHKIIVRH